jgi:hypothetical protein
MPCILGCLALAAPRLVIFLLFLFSDWLARAYDTTFWPFLGFLFMPMTTLAYALAINAQGSVGGIYLIFVIVAVLLDLGLIGGGAASRRRKRVVIVRQGTDV